MITTPRRYTLGISAFLLLTAAGGALTPASAQFYRGGILGVGTRAMGLSGAFTAVANDPSAAYWNPAGLVQLDRSALTAMYGSYLNDKNRNLYLAFEYPLPDDIHLALSTNNLFYTDIPGAHEDQYTGSVAIPLDFVPGKRLMAGANLRYLFSDAGNGNGTAQGMGVDLGFLFRQPFKDNSEFRAALVLTDLSTSIRYDQTGVEQTVPSQLTAGLAYRFDLYTLVAADFPWTLSSTSYLGGETVRVRAGVEHWFFDGRLGLRAGCISFTTLPAEFSIGASYRAADWSVDYAYANHPDLGNNHRLSVGYFFDSGNPGQIAPKPFMVQSLVGDGEIYLKWDIPKGSKADGYLVYIRPEGDKDFHRARQQLLKTKYCLLRGARNGVRYHVFIRSVVDGQEKYACDQWVAVARPMTSDAQKYYDQGMALFQKGNLSAALYSLRKAEEFDPNNYDIKDLINKLETSNHEGLVPDQAAKP